MDILLSKRMRMSTVRAGPTTIPVEVMADWVTEVEQLEMDLERMTRANEMNVAQLKAKRSVRKTRTVS